MPTESLAGGLDDFRGQAIAGMEARRRHGRGLGSMGHEMVGGLVGIGECIAILEPTHDGEQLLDDGGQAIGLPQRFVDAAVLESIDNLVEGCAEAIGGA